MSQRLLHIRSAVPGKIPTTSSIELGQLAINTFDGRVFTKQSASIGFKIRELITGEIPLLQENGILFRLSQSVQSVADFVYVGNRVGIGTSSPAATLHVVSDSIIFGYNNNIDGLSLTSGENSSILGGQNNLISGSDSYHCVIVCGANNVIDGTGNYRSFIGSGENNKITNESNAFSFIGNGYDNKIDGIGCNNSFIGSGETNEISGEDCNFSFIGSGKENKITGTSSSFSVIAGGHHNVIYSSNAAQIIGGIENSISSSNNSVIIGTYQHLINKSNTLRVGFEGTRSLEVSNDGMLIRALNASERNAILNAEQGQLVYNLDTSKFNYYTGATWVEIENDVSLSGSAVVSLNQFKGNVSIAQGSGIIINSSSNVIYVSSSFSVNGQGNRFGVFSSTSSITGSSVLFESGSRVGIKIQNSLSYDLHVSGTVFANDFYTSGQFHEISSLKYKIDVKKFNGGLEKIMMLNPVEFKMKNSNERKLGLIAEEIEKILPEAVGYKNGEAESISYSTIVPLLINAIKELKKEIEELKKDVMKNDKKD